MTRRYNDARLVITDDSSLWIYVRDEHDEMSTYTIIPTSKSRGIVEWLLNPDTVWEPSIHTFEDNNSSASLSYSHTTDTITLKRYSYTETFPTSDEGLAHLVRYLKRLDPMDRGQSQLPIPLPTVTDHDLATKRQIMFNPAYPSNYPFPKRRAKRPAALSGPILDPDASARACADAMAVLLGKLP